MTIHRRALLGAAGLAALVPAAAQAQTRWQMATPYADGNFHTRNIRAFLQDVEQAAGFDSHDHLLERDAALGPEDRNAVVDRLVAHTVDSSSTTSCRQA